MKTYKGFDKDLKCRGFQYEVGKEYETDRVEVCTTGFHACENPLDCFKFYAPGQSVFHEVEQDGEISRSKDDSKIASTRIKIGAEIGLNGLINAGVKFILERVKFDESATNTGYQSAATNTGYQSAATNTGYQSAATNTGYQSAATNTGRWSAATNTGDQSAATNTGDQSAATNTGDQSAATNTGRWSAATNTGDQSAATNTGYQSAATVGKGGSVAIVTGYRSKAKASVGSAICVCERGEWNGNEYPLINIKAAIIDGKKLKADTFYMLKNGEFVEAESEDE